MNEDIKEIAPAIVYDEENEILLQSDQEQVEESPQPINTPIVLVTENHETFDTPVEDMFPQTLILLFVAMGLVLAMILRGSDYERLN